MDRLEESFMAPPYATTEQVRSPDRERAESTRAKKLRAGDTCWAIYVARERRSEPSACAFDIPRQKVGLGQNNRSERALRQIAIGRKNSRGAQREFVNAAYSSGLQGTGTETTS